MAPLTKDTLEVTSIATDTNKLKSGTAAKTEQPAGHLRADAVSLEVPVKVHGSRVTEGCAMLRRTRNLSRNRPAR